MHRTIFINYRRTDDPSFAHRLFDRLKQNFTPDELFFDVDSIEPGFDFVEVLDQQVAQCDVFLAVIGKDWLHSTDDAGHRRLDDPNDFVRIEIESALRRGKRLIPVLVDDAQIPRADDLPESLKPLARRHAVRLANERFHPDSERLIRALEAALSEAAEKREWQARERREAREREQAEEEAERERQAARAGLDQAHGTAPRRRAVDQHRKTDGAGSWAEGRPWLR